MYNYAGASNVINILAAASQAATLNSGAIDLRDYDGPVAIIQNKGAGTGTLDGKIQDSDDGATAWVDVIGATFVQAGVAADVQKLTLQSKSTRRFIRYTATIVTGPHLVGVTMLGVKKLV